MMNRAIALWQSKENRVHRVERALRWPEVTAQKINFMRTKVTPNSGFTLVEIMIVCAIVGMLTAIAVPAFAKNRAFSRRSACMANLKQIESAKTVWAQENRKGNADVPVDTELFGPNNYLRQKPSCPADGVYSLNPVDTKAGCSLATIEGHTL